MRKFTYPIKVMFADCDPAQIVFYPKFFQWFDNAAQAMFTELGMPWSVIWPDRNIAGFPIVDAGAKFMGPARMDDAIEVESWVEEWRGKTFLVRHDVKKNGEVIAEGHELRACVVKDPDSPKGIRAANLPADIMAKFEE